MTQAVPVSNVTSNRASLSWVAITRRIDGESYDNAALRACRERGWLYEGWQYTDGPETAFRARGTAGREAGLFCMVIVER